jgi:hypothetical protein
MMRASEESEMIASNPTGVPCNMPWIVPLFAVLDESVGSSSGVSARAASFAAAMCSQY